MRTPKWRCYKSSHPGDVVVLAQHARQLVVRRLAVAAFAAAFAAVAWVAAVRAIARVVTVAAV